jgi:protein-S-isoprenylcysteine O-methyltransferase Ste14
MSKEYLYGYRRWLSWLAVFIISIIIFTLIHAWLREFDLDILFQQQLPLGAPGRSLVILAIMAPFGIALLISIIGSVIARSATLAAYAGSWIVYASLLSQTLLSMSGAWLLIFPLILPVEAIIRWLNFHPAHKGYLPIRYTIAHEAMVTALIAVGFAIFVVGIIEILRAKRQERLAVEGLYVSMRHPQHLGIILWTLGFALWGASITDLAIWYIVSSIFVLLAIHEEGKLIESYGTAYEDYRRHTLFMPPFLPIRGSLLPHGGTGRECGLIASLFIIGIVVILLVFYILGVPQ